MARPQKITLEVGADTTALADALDTIAEALSEAAHRIRAISAQDAPGGAATVTVDSGASFDDLPPDEPLPFSDWPDEEKPTAPEGHAAICPKHRKAYVPGRYGLYCQSTSDEPGWTNRKGYCQITPKSAAAWLAQHAVAR